MFTKIIQDFKYNGLGFSTSKIPESKQQKVEIIGVMKPVDPGFVTVKLSNNEWKQVPTLVLEKCPNIDFEEMLTREQMKRREKFGALLGTGVDEPRVLVELKDCPLRK